MCCHGTDLRFRPGRCSLAIEMWMNMIYICHLWVGLFKYYCLIWFAITLTSLPSAVRMNTLSRGYLISLRLWRIRFWAAEPRWACWVKQSSGWSTALVQCEPEINSCCPKLLRLRDCLSPEQNWKEQTFRGPLPCEEEVYHVLSIHFPFVLILPQRLSSGIYSFFRHHSNGLGDSMHKSQLHEVWILFFVHIDLIRSGFMPLFSHETCLLTFIYWHAYYWGKLSLDLSLDS